MTKSQKNIIQNLKDFRVADMVKGITVKVKGQIEEPNRQLTWKTRIFQRPANAELCKAQLKLVSDLFCFQLKDNFSS